jgi:Tfp pilus assembly protein PilV
MRAKNSRPAFSLMEVIVGAVIMAAVFGGLTAIFVNVRHYVLHANHRLVATNLARRALSNLYVNIRADQWADAAKPLGGTLAGATHSSIDAGVPASVAIDGFNYGDVAHSNSYTVTTFGDRQYRQVTVQINYPQN